MKTADSYLEEQMRLSLGFLPRSSSLELLPLGKNVRKLLFALQTPLLGTVYLVQRKPCGNTRLERRKDNLQLIISQELFIYSEETWVYSNL